MQDVSMRWIGVKLHISAWRQVSIAISCQYCREHPFQNHDPGEDGDRRDEDDLDHDEDDPWDLQSRHGTHVAGMIYACELMEGSNMVIGQCKKFHQVSSAWHRFLQLASAHDGSGVGHKRKRGAEDDMQEVQWARWKRLREVDIHRALKTLVGKEWEFR